MYRCRIHARDSPVTEVTKAMLKPSERRLIEIAHDVGFGRLPDISVRNGELQFGATVKTERRHRLGVTGKKPRPVQGDFLLKQHHLDLIAQIRQIKNGIVSIEIEDGLPVKLVVGEDIGI